KKKKLENRRGKHENQRGKLENRRGKVENRRGKHENRRGKLDRVLWLGKQPEVRRFDGSAAVPLARVGAQP
ncbi:hypothetical protein PJP07_30200, partial [Mycobacterium kansasii]